MSTPSQISLDGVRPSVVDSASRISLRSTFSTTSAASSTLRVRQFQDAVDRANAVLPPRNTAGLFKAACSTDLLFLIDTTGSMAPYINAVEQQVKSTIAEVKGLFFNETDLRVAVLGYKDHGDSPNIQFQDFTTSVDQVLTFLNKLYASGGGDDAEDVLGGIQTAVNASWTQQTRCLVHIADAPGHGRDLHYLPHYGTHRDDRYIEPGSEPHGLTYPPLINTLVKLNVDYIFLSIHTRTDRMALAFANVYAAAGADARLLPDNKYGGPGNIKPRRSGISSLTFTELLLGKQYSTLQSLIVRATSKSISNTSIPKSLGSPLNPINEDEEEAPLETDVPQWDKPGWLDNTWEAEGVCPEVMVYSAHTLADMMFSNENIRMSFMQLTLHTRSTPFNKGAMRTASYARTASSSTRFVTKSFLNNSRSIVHMIEDMQTQALCKAFALEFNGLLKLKQPIDFVVTVLFIDGVYVKYNNNGGYVKEDTPNDSFNRVAQAFSHFTFERSWGNFMVVDLQGVGNLLTDPVVHTRDPNRFKLNDLNMNSDGFKFFFATHFCNSYEFRYIWPAIEPTTCCSNKLCQRIIQLASAHKSFRFVGHHWCDGCWVQLMSSSSKRPCAENELEHDFEICPFYYEPQGKLPPRKCPEHLDVTVSTAALDDLGGFGAR
ncbi:hypothetical protein B0T21DRAFT_379721 [Apiosordaria backusii]|uniref:Alpha-type protein kinase domain-containing protein n=1 Tax=Apiosordaria backusii TaxID=314023 RepID=A0AA40EY76_9PEZI|nr:hypothetical protein B0T21DRAFT_379721 [Apiosordaria backusii]